MGWLKRAVLMMCVWGTTTYASLPPNAFGGEREERQAIMSWMEDLNGDYAGLNVRSRENLTDGEVRQQTLFELQLLDEVLRLERRLPPGHLVTLACSNIVCGGKSE